MTCQEVLESITAAVDGALSTELVPRFQDHITRCDHCRAEFELEQATKTLLRDRLMSRTAPPTLRQSISTAIAQESVAPIVRRRPGFFGQPAWRVAAAGSVAVLAALVYFVVIPSRSHHPHTSPADGNIIHQTYNNYDGILDGRLLPQVASSDPAVVEAFFQPAVDFRVNIPKLPRYTLVGGNSTTYGTRRLAHLVYKNDNDVVYLYEARLSDVLDGTSLSLPPDVLNELKQTGWYFENHIPDCSLIVWITDSLICCVIADITKDQLLASLQESE